MRRAFTQLITVGFLAASFAALPLGLQSAVAAPAVSASAPACPHPSAYPPSPNATVEVTTTSPVVGERIKISGVNYCPTESVNITLRGAHVATAHTNSSGSFDPEITVTGPVGSAQVCGIGASGLARDRDCVTLHIRESSGQGATSTPVAGSGGGGPAFTGTDIALLIALGVLLLAGGIAFATAGRSRVAAHSTQQ